MHLRGRSVSWPLIVLTGVLSSQAKAGDHTVVVELQKDGGTVIKPAVPRVNVFTGDALVIDLKPADRYWRGAVIVGLGDQLRTTKRLEGPRLIIGFERARTVKLRHESSNTVVREGEEGMVAVTVWRDCRTARAEDACTPTPATAIPIRVESKPWVLQFSAGITVLTDPGFRRYAFRDLPATDPSVMLPRRAIERIDDSWDLGYRISAFAHYIPAIADWFAISAGFATSVPVTEVSAMVGLSIRARTFDVLNDGFLTVGLAVSPLRRLSSGLEVGREVPLDVLSRPVYESRYGLAYFAAMTFAFFGGEKEFKGALGGATDRDGEEN